MHMDSCLAYNTLNEISRRGFLGVAYGSHEGSLYWLLRCANERIWDLTMLVNVVSVLNALKKKKKCHLLTAVCVQVCYER